MKKQQAAKVHPNSPPSGDVEILATELIAPEISAGTVANQDDPSSISNGSDSISIEDIRLQAYHKWEMAGRPDGNDLFFWVEAEREVRRAKKI